MARSPARSTAIADRAVSPRFANSAGLNFSDCVEQLILAHGWARDRNGRDQDAYGCHSCPPRKVAPTAADSAGDCVCQCSPLLEDSRRLDTVPPQATPLTLFINALTLGSALLTSATTSRRVPNEVSDNPRKTRKLSFDAGRQSAHAVRRKPGPRTIVRSARAKHRNGAKGQLARPAAQEGRQRLRLPVMPLSGMNRWMASSSARISSFAASRTRSRSPWR